MINSAEQELEVFAFDVEPDILQEVPELRLAEDASPLRVVLMKDCLEVFNCRGLRCMRAFSGRACMPIWYCRVGLERLR